MSRKRLGQMRDELERNCVYMDGMERLTRLADVFHAVWPAVTVP